ncbi:MULTISPECIES: TolC family protein [Burkholderia]|uniref:TolC family protein n=1 Tax=Burkholderia TaxID=32008 RepID=UPI00119C3994|nr:MULTISPECIES: TolC family protein [Burkholderia]MDN7736925.1 TolC family protein [Burkholderia gladioli]TWC75828.1 adhesin transport system outer membrane protein [Burkholderia sp. SJZ089]TWD06147.1 adhesin transport system outer membrane protein [Burkholderia sp. SJZ115]TWD10029.1 adhesin transport system outer membrane protein [Burkholderia sp. SJZ091]
MAATKPSREPLVGDGLLTDLPLRRTTLSLLLATGVFAGSHVAEAGAATQPADAAKARLGDVPLRTDPVDTVLTISLSDDDVSGLDDAELAARRQRREARTERALRIAALWQQRRAAKAHESAARGGSEAARRRASPAMSAHPGRPAGAVEPALPDSAPPSSLAPGDARRTRSTHVLALPPVSLSNAAEPTSAATPDWATAIQWAETRMRTRARTLTARAGALVPHNDISAGGASLASAETGPITLAAILDRERLARNFPERDDRLHLADPGEASSPPSAASLSDMAHYWAADPAAASGSASMSPRGDLRPIFLAAVEAAFDRSPQVQFAYASYQAQLADVDEAKGKRWPQLQLSSRSRSVEFAGPASNAPGQGTAVTANLTTSVFDWGYLSKTIKSRKQTADAGKEFYDAQRENSAYTVATTMVELAKQRQLIGISQQFVDRMQQLVTMLSQIVEIDRGRASELTQARARLLQALASRDTVAAKARDTELTLRKLIGDRQLHLPSSSAWNIEPARLERLLSNMNQHPQIRQARAEAQAARLLADAVKASSRPAVNWVVSKTTGRDIADRRQPFQTMLTLSWNAFQGGSARAAQQAALARAQASERKVEQARLDLEYAIRAADEDARTLLERSTLYGDLVDETDRVRKAFFDQWYHLGKRTLLDVLQAENDHYGNRVSEITTRFDGYEAVFRELSSAGELMSWLKGTV